MLSDVFGFHPMAVQDCVQRNPVPKVHVYPDHVFVVLHAPEPAPGGHVHYVELDQFVGAALPGHRARPGQPGGRPAAAQVETDAVAAPPRRRTVPPDVRPRAVHGGRRRR